MSMRLPFSGRETSHELLDVAKSDDGWSVVHEDGTTLYTAGEKADALARAAILLDIAKRRGGKASSSDLLTLFPATAPQPLIFTALSAGEIPQREDVFDEATGTWKVLGVEIFRSGDAYKMTSEGDWVRLSFTTDDVIAFVESFEKLGWTPPAKVGHNGSQPWLDDGHAIGRVVRLMAAPVSDPQGKEQLGLFADFEKVPDALYSAIRDGRIYERSIEFWSDSIPDPIGDGKLRMVLKAVSLLGDELPAVRGMDPIDVAPRTFSAEGNSQHVKFTKEDAKMSSKPDTKGDEVVKLTSAEYEALTALKTENAKLAKKAETQATQIETLSGQMAKVQADAKSGRAEALCSTLVGEGRLTPALSALAQPLLAAADDETKDAVTLSTVDSDGNATEAKHSLYGAIAHLLSQLPKNANAPGAAKTGGAHEEETGAQYKALSATEKSAKVYELGSKLWAEDVAKDKSVREYASEVEACEAARKQLEKGGA